MWTMTTEGFFSATAHIDDPKLVVVRTRVLGDAEMLAERVTGWRRRNKMRVGRSKVEVLAYKGSDYPWRVIVTKKEYARFVAETVLAIDYTNFKNTVAARQGQARHDVYGRVWSVLLSLEKLPGAMKGHGKRAVAHPKFAASWRDYQPKTTAGQQQLDVFDAAMQIQGEGPHSDCTHSACRAPMVYPACHEKSVTV